MIRRSIIAVWLPALVLLGAGAAGAEQMLSPVIPPAMGEHCVEPNDVMRRDHMQFLLHQRDETVHSGVRGTKYSLVGCIGCHVQKNAQGEPIPVNAPGQFCASCHAFAGVSVDCFDCHAGVPAKSAARDPLPGWMTPTALSLARAARQAGD